MNLFQDMDPIFRQAVRYTFRTFITDVETPQKRLLGVGFFQELGIFLAVLLLLAALLPGGFAFWTISFRSGLYDPKRGWSSRYMFPGVILRGGPGT
jgi:hypothetical protein